jgi:copper transporter 1
MFQSRPEADSVADSVTETTPFLWSGQSRVVATQRAHVLKAVLYGIQNFYAFMIM